MPRNPETTITLSEKDAVNGTLDESKAEGTNVKANSASVDTQKTWQLNFVLTNGKSNFNLPITGGIGTAVFTIGGIMIMAGGGNASYICDPQKQKIGSFRKKRKKFRTENRQRKGRKTNRERKRQKEKGLSVCAKKEKAENGTINAGRY